MSTKLAFNQQLRNRRKKQKQKRTAFLMLLFVIILILLIVIVNSFLKGSDNKNSSKNTIANEYIYPMPKERAQDVILNLNTSDGIKTAYLTFDDGPNTTTTPIILDTLRKYNIKATFFTVGNLLDKNPDISRRIYDEGHLLANHSYTHKYNELYASGDSFMNEVVSTHEKIVSITEKKNYPKFFRFPGGSYKDNSQYSNAKQEYKELLNDNGFYYCDWNALTGDAEKTNLTKDYLMKRIKETSKGKEDIVVLMHDFTSKKVSADVLPQVVEYLISQGYTFDTLDNI